MKSAKQKVIPLPTYPGLEKKRVASHRSNNLSVQKPGSGLKLRFQRTRLGTVLNYLQESAGFIIHVKSNVPTEHVVDVYREEPVDRNGAVDLLKRVLTERGCTVTQRGPLLKIIRSQDLKKHCIQLPKI
jgi:hypothetical protein